VSRVPWQIAVLLVATLSPVATSSTVGAVDATTTRTVGAVDAEPSCDDEPITDDWLDETFDEGLGALGGVGPAMMGADYQRAFPLDDGRVLWVFQDAYVELDGNTHLVHNAGAIQTGSCFHVLIGDERGTAPWVAADETIDFQRWYWPLDGYQADDDTFVLFVAEMEEPGGSYLTHSIPQSTWMVEIDLDTLGEPSAVGELEPAPDPTDALYGFEITEDDTHRYFYAQCHRQFGFGWLGHDECTSDVTIARQPLDAPDVPLEYWDGDRWQRNSRAATNIAPTTLPDGTPRHANPMQIERDGDRWIAVTKVDDWWSDAVVFDVAPSPEGPWTTTSVRTIASVGPTEADGVPHDETVASYFVSFVPSDDAGMTLAVSNNRWDGQRSDWYRPRFDTVPTRVWQ